MLVRCENWALSVFMITLEPVRMRPRNNHRKGGHNMKAMYIQEQGDIDKFIYGDLPEPVPGPGEVLVRLHADFLEKPADLKIE